MIRSELVQKLCNDHPDLTLKEIERVVSAFFDSITAQLQEGGRIELRGSALSPLVNATRARAATPAPVKRSMSMPSASPIFKPGKEMRERLNV